MCSCTAEARKQLNDERDEVLANWKEAESRVRGAKPLTAYPDGLPPTDLDGDDPSLPQLPQVAVMKARSDKPETCRSIKLPATDKWCRSECAGIECPADTCECDDYNARTREAERKSRTAPKTGMEQWRESEAASRATDTAARYPDGLAASPAENSAQSDYAANVAATTAAIEAGRQAIAEKETQAADAKAEKSETEESQSANAQSLASLNELLNGIHNQCDYIIKYFDIRQKSRAEEVDSIEEAKAILSGATFA